MTISKDKEPYQAFEKTDKEKLTYFCLLDNKGIQYRIKYDRLISTLIYPSETTTNKSDEKLKLVISGMGYDIEIEGNNLKELAVLLLEEQLKIAYVFNSQYHYLPAENEDEAILHSLF